MDGFITVIMPFLGVIKILKTPLRSEKSLENVAARRVNITKLLFRWFSKAGEGETKALLVLSTRYPC